MKRCPECRRDYYDETLLYCLDDGNALLDGPAIPEPVTMVFENRAQTQAPTQPKVYATDEAGRPTTGVLEKTPRKSFLWKAIVPAAFLILCAAGASVWYWKLGSNVALRRPSASMKVTRLTSGGRTGLPAISPDGKYVVYTLWEAGKGTLWLRQISSTSAVPLFQPNSEAVGFGGRTFSPNGEMVYFVITGKDNERGSLMEIPTLGGTPRRVLSDIASGISFAPDGRTFVFTRRDESKGASSLVIASLDGAPERVLNTRAGNDFFSGDASWSPDGTLIACAIGSVTGGFHTMIGGISVETGEVKPIADKQWKGFLAEVEWLRDGSGLTALASALPVAPLQIWHVGYPSGQAEQLTSDVEGYDSISVAADGTTMAARKNDYTQRLWVVPLGDPGKAKQITTGKDDGRFGLSWTPDGRMVYTVTNGENVDLALVNADGRGQRSLNNDAWLDMEPSVSADGKYIYFSSEREKGIPNIWRMNLQGADIQRITTSEAGDNMATCSPDGNWIVFISWRSGMNSLWRVSTSGGEPEIVAPVPVDAISFVGPEDAVVQYADTSSGPPKQRGAVVNVRTGEFKNSFDLEQPFWRVGGMPGSFLYLDTKDGINNLWAKPLKGGPPKQLTNFQSDPQNDVIFRFAVSPDQKYIALSRGNNRADVVLIKDFR